MTVYGGCPITRTQYIQQKQTQTSELNAGLSFFYLIRRIIYIMLFFLFAKRLDNKRIIVYTHSVVNREDYIDVVDML